MLIIKINGIWTTIRRNISTPSIADSAHTTSTTAPTPPIQTEPQDSLNHNSVVDSTVQPVRGTSSTDPSTLGAPSPTVSAEDLLPPISPFAPNPPGSFSFSVPSAPIHVSSTTSLFAPSSSDLSQIISLLHSMQVS
ncbi:hypothetical protein U1Q18_043181 [Sarracenia purpurea var. burkii]